MRQIVSVLHPAMDFFLTVCLDQVTQILLMFPLFWIMSHLGNQPSISLIPRRQRISSQVPSLCSTPMYNRSETSQSGGKDNPIFPKPIPQTTRYWGIRSLPNPLSVPVGGSSKWEYHTTQCSGVGSKPLDLWVTFPLSPAKPFDVLVSLRFLHFPCPHETAQTSESEWARQ